MAEQYISTARELKEYFFSICTRDERLKTGIMVRSKIRLDILTDIDQGKMILNGSVRRISFNSMGGGVYRAFIEKL